MPDFIIDTLLKDADQAVIDGNAALPGKVRDRIAKKKLEEREQLLFDALPKYSELKNELSKLSKKSDNDTVSKVDGKFVTVPGWKPETVRKIQDAEKKLAEFKQAYIWAIDGRSKNPDNGKWVDDPSKLSEEQQKKLVKIPDYEPLKKALKGGSSGGGAAPAEEETPAAE